jgi:predicted RNase H-related nuclease YkuK (DUF458 family)
MERVFKSLGNRQVVDLVPYLREVLSGDTKIAIYVGTDSQNIGDCTHYASVIVLHYERNGGHVLYTQEKVAKIRDRFSRLWKEVEFSMEVADFLRENGIEATYIDIDLNPDPVYRSNSVLRAALGFVESKGYSARCKPFAVSASYVADRICNP